MYVGYGRAPWRADLGHQQSAELKAAGCDRVFIECGSTRGQPEFAAALAAAQRGDVLVVCRLDRLAKSVRQLGDMALELSSRGVGLRVLDRNFDTTREGGDQIMETLASLAAFDQALVHERRQLSAASCARRGGRKPSLGRQEIEKALEMLSDPTLTVGEIARQMGVQPSTLYRHIPGGRSALAEASA